jgi:hypothetical protein
MLGKVNPNELKLLKICLLKSLGKRQTIVAKSNPAVSILPNPPNLSVLTGDKTLICS